MTWTQFREMHSGGTQKEKWTHIFIEASMDDAIMIFKNRFGHHPLHVTCSHCGADYCIYTDETIEALSGYERGCRWDESIRNWVDEPGEDGPPWNPYQTMKQFRQRDDVLIIPADEILGRKDK